MDYKRDVIITEVCPRNGFQSVKEWIPTGTKVEIINRLIDCGYRQIEVTSFVHPEGNSPIAGCG